MFLTEALDKYNNNNNNNYIHQQTLNERLSKNGFYDCLTIDLFRNFKLMFLG